MTPEVDLPVAAPLRKPRIPLWERTWVRAVGFAALGAGLGASCPFWPEKWRFACEALVKVMHLAGGAA